MTVTVSVRNETRHIKLRDAAHILAEIQGTTSPRTKDCSHVWRWRIWLIISLTHTTRLSALWFRVAFGSSPWKTAPFVQLSSCRLTWHWQTSVTFNKLRLPSYSQAVPPGLTRPLQRRIERTCNPPRIINIRRLCNTAIQLGLHIMIALQDYCDLFEVFVNVDYVRSVCAFFCSEFLFARSATIEWTSQSPSTDTLQGQVIFEPVNQSSI